MSSSEAGTIPPIPIPLPPAPEGVKGPVLAWNEPVQLPCPAPPAFERHPVFAQYPCSVPAWPATPGAPRTWDAVHLENEWIRLLIVPEAGGLIFLALDGKLGSPFLPVPERLPWRPTASHIEDHGDGARTVWCSYADEKTRVRISRGFTLYPGRSYVELRVRLFNQTALPQPFRAPNFLSGAAGRAVHLQQDRLAQGRLYPFETKFWSEFLIPSHLPDVMLATTDAAYDLNVNGQTAELAVAVTSFFPQAVVTLEWHNMPIGSATADLKPTELFRGEFELPAPLAPDELVVRVTSSRGRELLEGGQTAEVEQTTAPVLNFQPPRKVARRAELHRLAEASSSNEQGEAYLLEALRRDPDDVVAHLALGAAHLRRGELEDAELHLRNAAAEGGEAAYLLAVCYRYLQRTDEARAAYRHAAQDYGWRAAALYGLAELAASTGAWEQAPKLIYEALRLNADNNLLRNLAAVVFRKFGRAGQANALVAENLSVDPLDAWARFQAGQPPATDNRGRLDVAFHCLRAGLTEEAVQILTGADVFATDGSVPMVHYTLRWAYELAGDADAAEQARQAASNAGFEQCRPYQLDELLVLQGAVLTDPSDASAFLYLGNWLRGHGRREQAIECWQIANQLRPQWAPALRNLGRLDEAFAADPTDGQLLAERDAAWKDQSISGPRRLAELEAHRELVETREDLTRELAGLYSLVNQPERSVDLLRELAGQDGPVTEQMVSAELKLGRRLLDAGRPAEALEKLQDALALDPMRAETLFWIGETYSALRNIDAAASAWQKALRPPHELGDQTYYRALASARLGDSREARTLLRQLWFHGRRVARERVPGRKVEGLLLQSQARVGMGQWKLARRVLDQLLELDPNHERALDLLRELPQ